VRRAPRLDANHGQITDVLRSAGASVWSTAALGHGFPDLVVGWLGQNLLVEVKDGRKPPSARRLTPDEEQFHRQWRGQVAVVLNPEDAIDLLKPVVANERGRLGGVQCDR
jgi:hypothetical protein